MKNNYKLWIALSFLVVFVTGIVGGVILEKTILNPKPKRRDRSSHRSGPHFPTIDEMAEAMNLTAEQQEQVRAVFQTTHLYRDVDFLLMRKLILEQKPDCP